MKKIIQNENRYSRRDFWAAPGADLIKNIPRVWDQTIALTIFALGETAAFARRRSGGGFIAEFNQSLSANSGRTTK